MTDLLDVIKKGMSTEIWGLQFYREAVEHTQDETGKRVFLSLVDEENKHLDILRGQYAAISGDKKWVSVEEAFALAASVNPTNIFPEAVEAKRLIPEGTSDVQALEMAMDFERRGYNLYDQAAKDATHPEEKRMWEFLRDAENKHYAFLDKTHRFLTNEGKWFFDEREFPFFEG
ncbi:MAG: ferritin family protein [Chloroflexi bacterium]|nr:ferritin family protein [Chloroflexota bacterium]